MLLQKQFITLKLDSKFTGLLAHFTTNFALIIERVFFYKLCQNLVDIQNGHTCGNIYPSCVSCVSNQSGDVQIDDVTRGSMSTPPNVDKSRLWQPERVNKFTVAFLSLNLMFFFNFIITGSTFGCYNCFLWLYQFIMEKANLPIKLKVLPLKHVQIKI